MVYKILGQLQIGIIAVGVHIDVHDHEGAVEVSIDICILITLRDVQLCAVRRGARAGEVLGVLRDDGADLVSGGELVADGIADVDA